MECAICFDDIPKGILAYRCSCETIYCGKCIYEHAKTELENDVVPVCPECKKDEIHYSSLIELASSSSQFQILQKYNQYLTDKFLHGVDIHHCPRDGCDGFSVKINERMYQCQKYECEYIFCGSCKQAYHNGPCVGLKRE